MKKIVLEIDDRFGDVLTISCAGFDGNTVNVTTSAIELQKTDRVFVDQKGAVTTFPSEE
jgi:hypothetical protein